MCVDYWRLNSRILKDNYSIPRIDDLFLTLNRARYFSTMDLSKAYLLPDAPHTPCAASVGFHHTHREFPVAPYADGFEKFWELFPAFDGGVR